MTTNKPKKTYKSLDDYCMSLGIEKSWVSAECAWQACSDSKDAEIEAKDKEIEELKNKCKSLSWRYSLTEVTCGNCGKSRDD